MKRLEVIAFVLATAVSQVAAHVLLYRQRTIGGGNVVANSVFVVFLAPVIIAVVVNTFFIAMVIPAVWKPRMVRFATVGALAVVITAVSLWIALVVAFNSYGT